MAGAAIIVSLQQLKSLLGITHFTKKMGIVPVLTSVFHNTHEWSWQTILMGFCFLVFLLFTRHIGMRKLKLFWVSAGAHVLSVILSTLLVFAFKAQNQGISVIGKLQEGLNPHSLNMLHFHDSYLGLVMKTRLITGIISLTEGIAVGRTFAALKNYQVDGNKEMIGIGLMNIVGSSTSCYITTDAFSRPVVNHNAGCKTAVSNIVMAVTVMVTLLFLMPLIRYTPNVVLCAIIITTVVGLIDVPVACQIWKIDKFDFLVMLCAFLGVLFISAQNGLANALRKRIQGISASRHGEDLNTTGKISTDYYTVEEMVKFKKSKRKKSSLREKEKLDIDALEAEDVSAGLGAEDLGSRKDGRRQNLKEEQERIEAEMKNNAYQLAYARADEASKALRQEQRTSMQTKYDDTPVFDDDDDELRKSLERARKITLRKKDDEKPVLYFQC